MAEVDERQPVEVRAFRGTRQKADYRAHVLTDVQLARILAAGAQGGLAVLSSLAADVPRELDKDDAKELAGELSRIARSGALVDLDRELTAVSELARWCARAPGPAWMTIQPSQAQSAYR